MKRIQLKAKEERRLLRGHLWVYRNELEAAPALDDGQLVDVVTDRGRFVARGFYQAQGGIAARILSRHQTDIDADFWRRRIDEARQFRERLFPGQRVYRWLFGESDGAPGLVADRYDTIVVAETSCAYYLSCADVIANLFLESDCPSHTSHSSHPITGVLFTIAGKRLQFGHVPPATDCEMDGLKLRVPLEGGQKTGLFLDQRANSAAARMFAPGARVLDGHCYAGIWSCHAALAGAAKVLAVDTSQAAIDLAQTNAQLNRVQDTCTFECADILSVLERGEYYDLIILDPPAFAKTRQQEKKALGLYQSLNRAAMDAIEPGGILVTSTCSHFVDREAFLEPLKRAATAAQRQAWILDVRGAAPDHPVLTAMPETAYLTCASLRIL
jgi:23S rRNA (cytosine1962-C5)-methyltransferase